MTAFTKMLKSRNEYTSLKLNHTQNDYHRISIQKKVGAISMAPTPVMNTNLLTNPHKCSNTSFKGCFYIASHFNGIFIS